MAKSNKKPYTIHGTEILMNKDKLREIVEKKNLDFLTLHQIVITEYNLDLSYKGFVSLISNRSTWKLLYAYAVIDVLGISLKDVFEIVEVDIEKEIEKRMKWKEKYQK